MLGFILISLLANAAKPEEVDTIIDQITYRLSISNKTATVITSEKTVKDITVLSDIAYKGELYIVNNIANYAFQECYDLRSAVLPNSVTSMQHRIFEFCRNLERVELPNLIDTIGNGVFYNCEKLQSVELPSSVTIIGADAFNRCKNLTTINMPQSLVRIYNQAFLECENLKEVQIEDISSWCNVILDGYNNSPFSCANANLYISDMLVEDLLIPEGVKSIGVPTWESTTNFARCSSIKSVTFPSTMEYINGFRACENLCSISIKSKAVIAIGAFNSCPSLETVNCYVCEPPILDNNAYYGDSMNAFYNSYPELMTLHVPEGTKVIYENTYGWKDFGDIIDDLPNDSGVDEVSIDESKPIEILNLNGILVFAGIGDYNLPKGVYIIRQEAKSKKVFVK